MTKFFIPELEGSPKQREELYQAFRESAAKRYPLGDARIYSVTFEDRQLGRKKKRIQTRIATVGRDNPYNEGGIVFAIFEVTRPISFGDPPSEGFLICTVKDGMAGKEYMMPIDEVRFSDTKYFDRPGAET